MNLKSKKSVERKIENNENHNAEIAKTHEMTFKKSAHTRESAMLSGLGSKIEEE